jgi:hypothetical protein
MTALDVSLVHDKAREAVRVGRLPNRSPNRTWGGPSVDGDCVVCGEPLKRDTVSFEIEIGRNGGDAGVDRYRMHVRCFTAWDLERQVLEGAGAVVASGEAEPRP